MIAVEEGPLRHVAYVYDGSLEGLLSAVFLAYVRREDPQDIVGERSYQPRLGQSCIAVPTDFDKADRVRKGVERKAGKRAFLAVMRASTCEGPDVGRAVFLFIRHCMSKGQGGRGHAVLDDLANPAVQGVRAFERRAVNEAEKMRQFVRFAHTESGVWFARVNPNASVVPLVMGYFANRLNDQPFILFDERHGVSGVYDGRSWQLVRADAVTVPPATDREIAMQEAWKRFYDALSVDSRYNPELRRHFMPVRLWRNLTEMQPRACSSPVR